MQHSSWYTWACVLAYSYSFIAFGLQVNLLGPTASVLARKLGVVEADLGVIFTINGLASILGAMPSGYLVDKMPGHLVLAAALAFEVPSTGGMRQKLLLGSCAAFCFTDTEISGVH